MRHLMRWLRQMQSLRTLSRVLAIGLMTVALLLVPAFSFQSTIQAQAASDAPDAPEKRIRIIQAEPNEVDPISSETLRRIQRKAEDLGDKAKRDIGDTGLKNLRKLPENVPETIDLVKKQRFGRGTQAQPETTRKNLLKRG
jgi:hypothetical protein